MDLDLLTSAALIGIGAVAGGLGVATLFWLMRPKRRRALRRFIDEEDEDDEDPPRDRDWR